MLTIAVFFEEIKLRANRSGNRLSATQKLDRRKRANRNLYSYPGSVATVLKQLNFSTKFILVNIQVDD